MENASDWHQAPQNRSIRLGAMTLWRQVVKIWIGKSDFFYRLLWMVLPWKFQLRLAFAKPHGQKLLHHWPGHSPNSLCWSVGLSVCQSVGLSCVYFFGIFGILRVCGFCITTPAQSYATDAVVFAGLPTAPALHITAPAQPPQFMPVCVSGLVLVTMGDNLVRGPCKGLFLFRAHWNHCDSRSGWLGALGRG